MFSKLRNRLICINLGITTMVIVIVFSTIYILATRSASNRPSVPEGPSIEVFNSDIENIIQISIENEKKAAAQDLLIMLIVSGVSIELVVAFISYLLAEEAIKPVREAYEAQKVFIANASHEIKTPLAAISANLEAADIHGNKWIKNVEKETEKLSTLNSELLTLAKTDLMEKSTLDEVDLNKIVSEEIKRFEPKLKKIKFTESINSHGNVKIAASDFAQILCILMDNAIKYCDKKINLKLDNHELTVENDGTKITPKDLEHIFERFYQADKSAEGVGLGLSIAKSVAMRNGWDLTAASDKRLTSFCLKF